MISKEFYIKVISIALLFYLPRIMLSCLNKHTNVLSTRNNYDFIHSRISIESYSISSNSCLRCVIIIIIVFSNLDKLFKIIFELAISIFEKLSSNKMIGFGLTNNLAIATFCFYPPDKSFISLVRSIFNCSIISLKLSDSSFPNKIFSLILVSNI